MAEQPSAEAVRDEVAEWLAATWDPERPLLEWRNLLADTGWGCPTWPREFYGRGLTPALGNVVTEEFRKVGAVLPEVNATTRTLKVRVEVANRDRALVPGMFATLHFRAATRPDALLVPSEALIATGERHLVMLQQLLEGDVRPGARHRPQGVFGGADQLVDISAHK